MSEQLDTMRQNTRRENSNRKMLSNRLRNHDEPAKRDRTDVAFDRRQELLMFFQQTINNEKTADPKMSK